MSNSLKDQLLGLGFKSAPREIKQTGKHGQGKTQRKPAPAAKSKPRPQRDDQIDLAKAYAIRAQKEKNERIAAEQARQEEARKRREGKAKLSALLQAARINDEKAEIARHFEYGGKIRRIYVTAEQLRAVNAGELAVVQLAGRYHLVSAADGEEAERLLPGALALSAGTEEPQSDDDYDDPAFKVPDDLVW